MARLQSSLVEEIESDALDSSKSVADALRKCIALGSRAGSEELQQWASQELRGYGGAVELPDYRVIVAPILMDGVSGYTAFTGQSVPPHQLPEMARRADLSETVRLRNSIGELEEMVRVAREGEVKMGLPGSSTLATIMTSELDDPLSRIDRVYWSLTSTPIVGILDQVRTTLVELVARLRMEMGTDQEIPSSQEATNAVSLAVRGWGHNVNVTTSQAADGGEATATALSEPPSPPWWKTTRAIWAFIVGLATIAAALFAYLQLVE